MSSTVLAALPATLLATAKELGLDEATLLRESGISRASLTDLDGRIPFAAHARLWASLVEHGPSDLGLALGVRLGARALGVVGHAMAHAQTVGEALACVQQHRRLVLEDALPTLTVEGGEASFTQPLPPKFARMRHPAEAASSGTLTLLRALAGDVVVHRVAFQHARPDDASPHRAVFGVVPTFGAEQNVLVVDATIFARKNRRADPALHAYLVHRSEVLAAEQGEDDRTADRVRRVVLELLADDTSADVVAKRLGTSARTLHRRLTGEGTNLATILDDARKERALALVADRSRSIGEIAQLLGYREGTAFARAFRRWTGASPSEHR